MLMVQIWCLLDAHRLIAWLLLMCTAWNALTSQLTPVCICAALFVWFIALLIPFYNTINAIMGSFGNSFTAFVFPTGAYLWVYRTAAARANAPKQPV